jgi:hypothetical protein
MRSIASVILSVLLAAGPAVAGAIPKVTIAPDFSEPVTVEQPVTGSAMTKHFIAATAIVSGTSDSGGATTMVDAARTEAEGRWVGYWIRFTSGALAGTSREITAFTAGTDTVTFSPLVAPGVTTETYEILNGEPGTSVEVRALIGTEDPSAGAGVAAPVGSSYCLSAPDGTAGEWLKTGAGDTAWSELAAGGGGPMPVSTVDGSILTGDTGTSTEGLVEEPPHVCIVDPLKGGCGDMPWDGGEGIFAEATDEDGIGGIETAFYWYDLVIA